MSLKFTEKINQHTEIGIWQIEETIDWFLSGLNLSTVEKDVYESFVNEHRKKQWLSYRCLLRAIIRDIPVNVEYDEHRKPFIRNHRGNISVSHAGEYSAVILSDKYQVGIDIEKITPRIEKIACRFLSNAEEDFIQEAERLKYLYIIWGAKEALYKLYGKRNLDFQKQIRIQPFDLEKEAIFTGSIINGSNSLETMLFYRFIDDYVLVYTLV